MSSQQASLAVSGPGGEVPILNWFYLAMAQHRLGREDDARNWLDQAAAATISGALSATDWIEAQLLRREAEGLIQK